ncbi:coiled-coil domain-containing protein 125 isoform X1 [Lampris incognitus]|uniref:coiled-coil domain-containing protein 125 isoform X1 n=1 Tax=Lampris incognitus TaxID=2546036 RepID=UPI0024B57615|nr:coiled-coil domain-containing protein 125 isoform X1 [Lampris incognitus]
MTPETRQQAAASSHSQMQKSQGSSEATETGPLEDDMVDGDLGDGMSSRQGLNTARKKSHSLNGGSAEHWLPREELYKRGNKSDVIFCLTPKQAAEGKQSAPCWRLTGAESLVDFSKAELRERLQEVTEAAEVMQCELEVTRRYLEGKYEALKILQGKAILDKATSHTKSLLHKSEERVKDLEKEVNSLQWETTFNQVQLKKYERSWEQKYDRISTENKALSDRLKEKTQEVQELRTENAGLSQQCFELLSMPGVAEQRGLQSSELAGRRGAEGPVVELGVLLACRCPGARQPCLCARSAAACRKQLLQLRQELDAQRRRKEEAQMVADAFRIAFEQQLGKQRDHLLLLAEPHMTTSMSAGASNPAASVGQRLRGRLPSSLQLNVSDKPMDTLHNLLDLLNDKEEALAHQRKVSLMLARHTEELEKQLQTYARCQQQQPSVSKCHPKDLANLANSMSLPQEASDSRPK